MRLITFALFIVFIFSSVLAHAESKEKTGSLAMMLSTDNEYQVKVSDKIKGVTLKADYAFQSIEVNDVEIVTIDRGSLGIFYDKPLNPRWKVWFYDITKFDNIHETRSNLLGAGPKFYILKGDHKLSFSTGIIYDYDDIKGEGFGRYSNRPKYAYKKDLAVVYYYQPAIEDSGDYIEKLEAWAIVPYTGRHFKLTYIKEYQSKVGLIDPARTELWANFDY